MGRLGVESQLVGQRRSPSGLSYVYKPGMERLGLAGPRSGSHVLHHPRPRSFVFPHMDVISSNLSGFVK